MMYKRLLINIPLLFILLMTACDKKETSPQKPVSEASNAPVQKAIEQDGQASLPHVREVFDLLVEDINEDGRHDVAVVDHSNNEATIYYQSSSREFAAGKVISDVGFHPGTLLKWPGSKTLIIEGAEGENAIRSFSPDPTNGLTLVSNHPVMAPRFITHFTWPQWGDSLAIAPYANGYIALVKQYDPLTGKASGDFVVPLSEKKNTIRSAEKITVADIDGDKIDELITVGSITNEVFAFKYPGSKATKPPKPWLLGQDPHWGMPNEAIPLDLDHDGDNDLLVPDEAAPGLINVLINQGKGTFKAGKPIDFPGKQGIMELRSGIDKDGVRYLVAAGYGYIALYQWPKDWKDGMPIPRKDIPWVQDLTFDMEFKDLDGDGWLDIVLGRTVSQKNIWIAYGSLWDRFDRFKEQQFILN